MDGFLVNLPTFNSHSFFPYHFINCSSTPTLLTPLNCYCFKFSCLSNFKFSFCSFISLTLFTHLSSTIAVAATATATAAREELEWLKRVKGLKMSSSCGGPRFVRCRVRDLASCFYACRLPLEEEPDTLCSKPPEMPSGSIVSKSKAAGRGDKTSRKMSKKHELGQSVNHKSSPYNSIRKDAEPSFAEEDYMVFCFREDGAIHMINEGKISDDKNEYDDNISTTAAVTRRPISRKGNEKGSKKMQRELPPDDDEIKEINQVEQAMDSFESCESNISDTTSTSTSSFAFPVLGIEWIGSPVHMPKSEKHDGGVRLHCCRF